MSNYKSRQVNHKLRNKTNSSLFALQDEKMLQSYYKLHYKQRATTLASVGQ